MLLIFCAEMEEAKHIRCNDAFTIVTGVGYSNVMKALPRFNLKSDDKIINIGYAGSNKYPVGSVVGVNKSRKLVQTYIKERGINLEPLLPADVCYTADNFINKKQKNVIPLVDMELYYLAFIFPHLQSIKIVSDNFNLKEHRQADFKESWEQVNEILKSV